MKRGLASVIRLGQSSLMAIALLLPNGGLLLAQEPPAPTVLETIRTTGLLKIAIREDAVPLGYRDLNNDWSGICLDFAAILKRQVINKIQQPAILVKLFKSTLFNRFDLVNDQVVYLECGPNSIRQDLSYDNVTFSQPFLWTGTQFLIRAADKQRVNPNGSLAGLKIGVLRYTTNEKLIQERYPQATIQIFQGATGRLRGVQALRQERIDAFASDGILLLGEALSQNLAIGQDFLIVPPVPLNCEQYGLILPRQDPQWIELINQTLALPEAKSLNQKWLGPIFPQVQKVINYCQNAIETMPSPDP
ncbi:MAG: amino acid ABC transporter substrate-binding protein [Microcystaceae cyanobacterium]